MKGQPKQTPVYDWGRPTPPRSMTRFEQIQQQALRDMGVLVLKLDDLSEQDRPLADRIVQKIRGVCE